MSGKGGDMAGVCEICGKEMNGGKLPEHLIEHLKEDIDE